MKQKHPKSKKDEKREIKPCDLAGFWGWRTDRTEMLTVFDGIRFKFDNSFYTIGRAKTCGLVFSKDPTAPLSEWRTIAQMEAGE